MNSIIIIADTSGSMYEMNKLFLLKNLIYFIKEFHEIYPENYQGCKINYFTWNTDLRRIEFNNDSELPDFVATGRAEFSCFMNLLEEEVKSALAVRVLILSDGNILRDQLKSFTDWSRRQINLSIHTVAVGADSITSNLIDLSTNNKYYGAEEISAAIQSLAISPKKQSSPPVSINEIIINK